MLVASSTGTIRASFYVPRESLSYRTEKAESLEVSDDEGEGGPGVYERGWV